MLHLVWFGCTFFLIPAGVSGIIHGTLLVVGGVMVAVKTGSPYSLTL